MSFVCPAGHPSDDSDYCSVCGAAIVASGAPAQPTAPPQTAGGCPVCGEPRSAGARYCEVCRYDFVARSQGNSAPVAAATLDPVKTPAPGPAVARWTLIVTVDPTLDTEPDAAARPPPDPERLFPVDAPELLVGRRDDSQQIRPAIALHDPGASRRHARFVRGADGAVSLHDLGSTNGTQLNGKDVVSGSVVPLHDGDQVTLGRWTRIRLEARK